MWKVLRFVQGYEVEKEEEESIGKALQVSEINITEGRIDYPVVVESIFMHSM